MVGLIEWGAGPQGPAAGGELGVPPGNRPSREPTQQEAPDEAREEARERSPSAMARLYAVLCQAADAGEACPGNRALCVGTGVAREAKIAALLRDLEARRMIAIERTAFFGGARRVVIRASGKRTGWSLHGRRPMGDADAIPANGMAVLARRLRQSGGRFADVTAAEARRMGLGTPADPGMPLAPAPSSYMGCALASVIRDEPGSDGGPTEQAP